MNEFARRFHAPEVPERLAALRVLVGLFGTVFLVIRTGYLFDVARLPAARFDAVGPLAFLDRPLPVDLVHVAVFAGIAAGALFTLGWHHRVSGPAHGVLLVLLTTYDNSWQHLAHAENLLALQTLVLGFAPAADVWSLDARRRARAAAVAGRPVADAAPAAAHRYGWPVRLISVITVCTYVLAGWAKLRNGGADWITGDVLRNQIAHDNVRKAVLGAPYSSIGGRLSRHAWVFPPLALASVCVELGAPFALLRGRIRRAWVAAAWGFHLGVLVLMAILFAYPLSGVAYASLLRPDEWWQRRVLAPRRARTRTADPEPEGSERILEPDGPGSYGRRDV